MLFNKYNNNKNVTGKLIRKYRESLNLSREAVSAKLALLGITLYGNDIYRIETNQRTVRDFELIALCDILQIEIEDIRNCLEKE